MLKGIIFDFDGVLVESVAVKGQAFAELFSEYPDRVEEIVRFHNDNGGMNRFRKFEHIYHNILHKPLDEDEKMRLGERFSEIVFAQVVHAPFVAGAEDVLECFSGILKLFVVSATPQDELREIVAARNMTHYFTAVLGAPAGKADNINAILANHYFRPEELVFIGDALADYEGARATGVPFIGRVNSVLSDPFDERVPRLSDLQNLEGILIRMGNYAGHH